MKNFILTILIISTFQSTAFSEEKLASNEPIAQLREFIGGTFYFRTPTFSLYKNHQVIYEDYSESEDTLKSYKTVTLSKHEFDSLYKTILHDSSFFDLKDRPYICGNRSHLPQSNIIVNNKRIMVSAIMRDNLVFECVPQSFKRLFDLFVFYTHPKAKAWNPEFVDITISPVEDNSYESLEWPKIFPKLNSSSEDELFTYCHLILEYKTWQPFYKLCKENEKFYFKEENKIWSLSTSRILFPHEYNETKK